MKSDLLAYQSIITCQVALSLYWIPKYFAIDASTTYVCYGVLFLFMLL